MGTNTLLPLNRLETGDVISPEHFTQYHQKFGGALVGTDPTSFTPSDQQDLGTAVYPWNTLRVRQIVLNNQVLDLSNFVSSPTRLISGQVRGQGLFPAYLGFDGTRVQALGSTTNLLFSVGGTSAAIAEDIFSQPVTLGDNSAGAGRATLVGSPSIYQESLEVSTTSKGSGWNSTVGRIAFIYSFESSQGIAVGDYDGTNITNINYNYFFGENNEPVMAQEFGNNTVVILSYGYVFISIGGVINISYNLPTQGPTAPQNPATNDYWFDTRFNIWRRYDGSSFVTTDQIKIGEVVVGEASIVGVRPELFDAGFSKLSNITLSIDADNNQIVSQPTGGVNIWGRFFTFRNSPLIWNSSSLDIGSDLSQNTLYQAYLSEQNIPIVSEIRPIYLEEHNIWVHPFNSARWVGMFYTEENSTDIDIFFSEKGYQKQSQVFAGNNTTTSNSNTLEARNATDFSSTQNNGPETIFFDILSDGRTLQSLTFRGTSPEESQTTGGGEFQLNANAEIFIGLVIEDPSGQRQVLTQTKMLSTGGSNRPIMYLNASHRPRFGRSRFGLKALRTAGVPVVISDLELLAEKQ